MSDATFKLHKWHSNCPDLEEDDRQQETEVQSTQLKTREKSANSPAETEKQLYAKQQLQVKLSESKLLGVKVEDIITVQFHVANSSGATSKCEVLAKLAKVYDPLGLVCPVTLQGKQIYCELSDYKAAWDAPIPENLRVRWLMGTVTPRRNNHTKTHCTTPATSSLIRATCLRRHIDPWSQSSGVLGRTPRWNHTNPCCSKSKISQKKPNCPKIT